MTNSAPECGPPPTKKAKTEADRADHIGERNSPSFFFDAFPSEVLDNVLRYFSRLPEVRDWVHHVSLESIIELYGVNGELGKFMKPRFNALCISDSFKAKDEIEWYLWENKKDSMLWANDLDVGRRFVRAGGGQALHTIIVGMGMYFEDSRKEIVGDFQSNCPNVTSLSIADEHGAWVSRFGGQLEKLEIISEESSINLRNCTYLRELNLSLESEDLAWSDLWDGFGEKLEVLALRLGDGEDIEFGVIKTNCPNLRRISMYGMCELNEGIAMLLSSYGDQLEYCHVEYMDESEVTIITSVCKNARFSAIVSSVHAMYLTLKVLAYRLNKMKYSPVYEDRDFLNYEDLTNAWNACVNIGDLSLRGCSIELMKAIMASPKQHLKVLHVDSAFVLEEKEVKTLLDVASRGTVGVEEFIYIGRPICGEALNKFITRNKSSLSAVSLTFPGVVAYEKLDTFLPFLLLCHDLGVVSMQGFSPNMFKALRSRSIECRGGTFGIPFYS